MADDIQNGFGAVQFDRVTDGPVPNGLIDLLDPIASASIKDPGESQGLTKRSEV